MPKPIKTAVSSSAKTSTAAKTQLRVAIASVSESRLRAIVAKLAESLPDAENALLAELVTAKPKRKHGEHDIVSRWAVCSNCGEEYDMSEDFDEGECVYHSGDLEVNEDAFEDWDEDCHGPMDSKQNRREYPENFIWSCCDEDGLAEGCEKGEHVPKNKNKKARRT